MSFGRESSLAVALAETYESYRPLLFSIAYRMTGSATAAEDVLLRRQGVYGPEPEKKVFGP